MYVDENGHVYFCDVGDDYDDDGGNGNDEDDGHNNRDGGGDILILILRITMVTITLSSSAPKSVSPRSKAVGGTGRPRLVAVRPSSV